MISAELKIDMDAMQKALDDGKMKLGEHVEGLADITTQIAKRNSPVGWDSGTNRLPGGAQTPGPRGYKGGTNQKSITAEWSTGEKSGVIGEMGAGGAATWGEAIGNILTRFGLKGKDFSPKFRIYTQSGYGGWLELGTKRMAARPYIMPAFQEAVQRFMQKLEHSL